MVIMQRIFKNDQIKTLIPTHEITLQPFCCQTPAKSKIFFFFTLRSSSTADFSLTGIDGSDSMNL